MEFPVHGVDCLYIVEERPLANPGHVMFSWSRNTEKEALDVFVDQGRKHPDRLYRMYFHVDQLVELV